MSTETLTFDFLVAVPEGAKSIAVLSPQMNPTVFGDSSLQDFDEKLLTYMMGLTLKSSFEKKGQPISDLHFEIPEEGILHNQAKFSASFKIG